jgi:hypothetical protein
MGTEGKPSASGVVYLFGDRFAKKARLGGEKLVFGGQKVKLSDLADKLLVAAFADLANRGYLALEVVEQKRLGLFTSRDVQVTRAAQPAEPLFGLEAAIWGNIADDPQQDRIREIISRITGGTQPNPWRDIVDLAKNGLAEQGFLLTEKEVRRLRPDKIHWSPNEESILPHEGRVDEVKALLSSLETRDPTLHKQLVESVKKGVQAMVEEQDFGFDDD